MATLGEFLKSINKKTDVVDDLEVEHDYSGFFINRSMSYFLDTIFYANEMNMISRNCPKIQQYMFYYNGVRKRNRFSRWSKPEKESKKIKLIKESYGYNTEQAENVLPLLPTHELVRLAKLNFKGG